MQKILTVLFIGTAMLAASCSNNSSPKDALSQKKAELDSLKKEEQTINDKIIALQDDIAKTDTSASSQKTTLVTVTTLAPENFTHYLDLQGKVDAVNISVVAPRNGGGQVKELYIQKGQEVHKGQLLLKMDDALAQIAVKNAQESINGVEVQSSNAADVFKRYKNLFDQGIGTQIQLNNYRTQAEYYATQLKNAQESLRQAEEQLNFTSVYSDVDGVAEDVNIRVGELFTASAPTPQIRIVNTTDLKVTAQVPENYISKVNVGDNVQINFPDINKTITAKITVAGKIIDPNSRSFYIEIHLPADKDLRPNQIADVKIQDYSATGALTVPINTLQTDEKGKFVLVADNINGKLIAKKKPVSIGQSYGDKAEVTSGLQAGDKIITNGYQSLYDGQPVTIAQ